MYNTSSNFHTLYPFSGGINDVINFYDVIVCGRYLKQWQQRQQQKVRDILCILSFSYCYLLFSIDYQPVERSYHSTIKVEDHLYMWGGWQPGLPGVHDSEEKRAMCSVMEVCHLASGRWEQKPTTGTPPLGVRGYAAAAIGNEIFYYGGWCGHPGCMHNSLFSFNVNTFNWKELSPTSPHHGPRMKYLCDMVAVQLDGEDYLVVIGGTGPSDNNTPKQPGAQYSVVRCNEIHYYKLSSGQCVCVCVCLGAFPVTK